MKPGLFQSWREAIVKLSLAALLTGCICILILAILGKLGA